MISPKSPASPTPEPTGLGESDDFAGDELLQSFESQFRVLASRMLSEFPVVKRWEQTDDIIQASLMNVHRHLRSAEIQSELHRRRLAARVIRHQLLDLARHYRNKSSHAANHESTEGRIPPTSSPAETPGLQEWAEFHQRVGELPARLRDSFELIWYGGLSHAETASNLGINQRQCQRRWREAKIEVARGLRYDLLF